MSCLVIVKGYNLKECPSIAYRVNTRSQSAETRSQKHIPYTLIFIYIGYNCN